MDCRRSWLSLYYKMPVQLWTKAEPAKQALRVGCSSLSSPFFSSSGSSPPSQLHSRSPAHLHNVHIHKSRRQKEVIFLIALFGLNSLSLYPAMDEECCKLHKCPKEIDCCEQDETERKRRKKGKQEKTCCSAEAWAANAASWLNAWWGAWEQTSFGQKCKEVDDPKK